MITSRNQFAKVIDRNRELLQPDRSVLEVTTEDDSIAAHLGRPVVRATPGRAATGASVVLPVEPSEVARSLPDGTFDTVVAHGLLEYVPPARRKEVILLLLGRTERRLILTSACDATAGTCDASMARLLQRVAVPVGPQLAYRAAHGCPTVREIYRTLQVADRTFQFVGNQSIMQREAGVLMDALYPLTDQLSAAHDARSLASAPIGEAEWDYSYDFLFEVDASGPRSETPPIVSPVDGRPQAPGTRIYAVYHQAGADADIAPVTPIYVGRSAEAAPPGALTDRVTSVPRLDNARWCELTAVYRIWKEGPVSEAVGFCHYRRLFDFHDPDSRIREIRVSRSDLRERATHLVPDPALTASLGDDWILTVFPRPDRVSIWEGYCGAHNVNDYCRLLNIIGTRRRDLMPIITQQFGTNAMYSNNLFVVPWARFDELCRLWFDVLGEFERRTPPGRSTAYQNREIGFLSERVLDLWIRHRRRCGTTVLEFPLYLVDDPPTPPGR